MTTVTFPEHIDKYDALVRLWNAAKAFGLGLTQSHQQPTIDDAKLELDKSDYIDYFFGKPIKTDFSKYPILKFRLYDRDAGNGTMMKVATESSKFIGTTKKLSQTEAFNLVEEVTSGIQVMDGENFFKSFG